MQQFRFKEWLARGIEPDPYNATYEGGLVDAQGCRITPRGAQYWEDFTLFPAGTSISYPWPQLFVGREGVYKFDQTTLSRMTNEDGTMTAFDLYTLARLASGYTFTATSGATITSAAGAVWHMADGGGHWIASNGIFNVIHFTGFTGAGSTKAFVSNDPFCLTCCEYKGKFLYGGIEGLINSSWVMQMNTLRAYYESESPDGDDNQIYYSSYDLESKFLWFWPWMYTGDKAKEMLNRRDSGFIGSGQRGALQGLARLGDGVVVYGAEGISYLHDRSEIRGFGRQNLLPTGVKSRGNFAGDEFEQYFIDVENRLWKITPGPELELLDYSVPLSALTTTYMSFDSVKRDLYIHTTSKGFLLSAGRGLSEIPQIVMSPHRDLGADRAILKESSNQGFLIQTGEAYLDGTRRPKFIHNIEVHGDNISGITVTVYGKVNDTGTFISLKSGTLANSPVLDVGRSASACYVVVNQTTHLQQVDDIVVNWDYFPIGVSAY